MAINDLRDPPTVQEVSVSEAEISCASCRYWEDHTKRCHRYAPQPTLGNGECVDGPQNAVWVLTNPDDWCGDYEPILEDESEEDEQCEEEDEWDADGAPKWSQPPAPPVQRRGLFG